MPLLLFCFAFLFFRADSFRGAGMVLRRIAEMTGGGGSVLSVLGAADFAILIWSIIAIEGMDLVAEKKPVLVWLGGRPMWQRWLGYTALANVILYFGVFQKAVELRLIWQIA